MKHGLVLLLLLAGCSEDSLAPYEAPKSDPDIAEPNIAGPNVEAPDIRAPDHWVDVFQQRDAKVDVLWVIDVSDSMEDERTQLTANFDSFMASLTNSGAQYQIGVTTTDLSGNGGGGTLIGPNPVISPATADPEAAFAQNLTLSPTLAAEQPLESARLVLSTDAGNALVRPDAALAVIILTDEDDSSIGDGGFYARDFLSSKGPGNQNLVTVSAIAGEVPSGCVIPGYEGVLGAGARSADKIDEVVTATNGVFGSICDQDFGPTLDGIGWKVAGLARIFPLSRDPILGTIVVLINGTPLVQHPVDGWQYREDINSVAFAGDYVPEANAEIQVRYGVSQ